ncbi:MAG: hypothetical protein RBT75_05155 [Anaerolineae bacterium]|nr:hypothetical protein [Anaerolineae bacterium]
MLVSHLSLSTGRNEIHIIRNKSKRHAPTARSGGLAWRFVYERPMGVTSLPAPTVTLEGAVRYIQERRVHVETVTGTFTVLLQASAPRLQPENHVRVTGTLRRRTTLRASYYEVLADTILVL